MVTGMTHKTQNQQTLDDFNHFVDIRWPDLPRDMSAPHQAGKGLKTLLPHHPHIHTNPLKSPGWGSAIHVSFLPTPNSVHPRGLSVRVDRFPQVRQVNVDR